MAIAQASTFISIRADDSRLRRGLHFDPNVWLRLRLIEFGQDEVQIRKYRPWNRSRHDDWSGHSWGRP